MPKITVHGGASNSADESGAWVQEPILPQERPGEGAFHAERNEVEEIEVDEVTDYSACTVKDLLAEIEIRNAKGAGLSTSGNKADLVARLVEDDEANADEE
jgi:hypothetical protein